MKSLGKDDYLKQLNKRSKDSRVYHSHQFVGLEIAMLLNDLNHKSLYIKLAKNHDPAQLMGIAKDIMSRRGITNPGAYFMTMVQNLKKNKIQ